MSLYSGKCDLCDSVEIVGIDKFLKECEIYTHTSNLVPLKIESEKDLVPFYPYLCWLMTNNKYYLCEDNFINEEENETKEWYLKDIIKEYKKAKRNKTEFNPKYWGGREEVWNSIVEVVRNKGEKTTLEDLEDIHTNMAEHYRKWWYEELVRVGWREDQAYSCAYGLRRFIHRIVKEKNNAVKNKTME